MDEYQSNYVELKRQARMTTYYVILYTENSTKCKLFYYIRNKSVVAWTLIDKGGEKGIPKGTNKLLEVMEVFINLIVVVFSQVSMWQNFSNYIH